MRRFHSLTLLTAVMLGLFGASAHALADEPLIQIFPDTPCDSVSCATMRFVPELAEPTVRVGYRFRDGTSFRLDSASLGNDTIPAGSPVPVPICFTPSRRGQITDSLTVIIRSGTTVDSVHIRITGRGIGPELEPTPSAVNFPRTDAGTTSSMTVRLTNVGELPFTFDASAISIPPPFQLATPGPIVIPPGGSIDITIVFAPGETGVYSSEAELRAGCTRRVQIGLNGATELVGTGAVLRVSKVGFNPLNDEETPCTLSRCTRVTISNAGNAPLVIEDIRWAVDTAGYRITRAPATPFVVGANDTLTFEVCIEAQGRGRLYDTLVVQSNSRTSIAFGMVIDFSASMTARMNCGAGFSPERFFQAIEQTQSFIARTLLHLPAIGIQDHLAVMRYSYVDEVRMLFPLQPITEPLKAAAQGILAPQRPSTCWSGPCTYTGVALSRMMDTLVNGPLSKRVIVLLSDGNATDDTLTTPAHAADALAARARSLGIRIYTVGIGTRDSIDANAYLTALALGSGGEFFDGNDCTTLQQALESITGSISRGHVTREPFGIRVTSPMVISSGDLQFDSTYYLSTSCRTMTLTNVGEGDVVIDSIALRDAIGATTPEFTFGSFVGFPITIPESGQVQIEVCFRPTGLRSRGGQTSFSFNSCRPLIVGSRLSGTGWAIAGMRIDDARVGLPGTIATMPVYLDSTLENFEVRTVTFQVRWNKSMLDLRAARPLEAAGAVSVVLSGPVRFEGRDAVADFVATGDFTAPIGRLAELEFLVLRGDTLASDVRLSALTFEDDNPKALMKNAGIVAFDSTCFRDGKAISLSAPIGKLARLDVAPVPVTRGTPVLLTIDADGPSSVRVSLFGSTGAAAAPVSTHAIGGSDRIAIPTASLSPGAYFLHIEDGFGATHVRSIVVVE